MYRPEYQVKHQSNFVFKQLQTNDMNENTENTRIDQSKRHDILEMTEVLNIYISKYL